MAADYASEAPDAALTHSEITASHWLKLHARRTARKHPQQTRQSFDFYHNLNAHIAIQP